MTTNKNNPFFNTYNTPHETIPFDKIKIEHFEEAFMEGIKREEEEIESIINNKEKPTFENTIIKHDPSKGPHYYDLLNRVCNAFSCLLGAETNDELEALAQKMSPILTQHANNISLNEKLFKRIEYVYKTYTPKDSEEKMFLEKCYNGFIRNGVNLNAKDKKKLRKLNEESGLLSLQFSQNLRQETKAFILNITKESKLKGLPSSIIQEAKQTAKEHKRRGWVFTIDAPSYIPFLKYAEDRSLRRKLYLAKNQLCIKNNDKNNLECCARLINIRRETAQLMGYKTYADYVLQERMAQNTESVYQLLNQLIAAYKPHAKQEIEEIKQLAKEIEGEKFIIKPWDLAYYSHKLKVKKYDLDPEMLRPYLKLENVVNGVLNLANKLYGITFKEAPSIPTYHPDVKAYEVFDKDHSFLAVLYTDFYPRTGKRAGAWMTEFQGQWIDRYGNNIRPHVSIVMNFSKPTADKPSLLTLAEVETLLHEFGHALHGIFANTKYESLSGTNVWWDFVELPSQFMENYTTEKEFLKTFAFHYKTGKVISDKLIQKIIKSKNFMTAYDCLRQVSFGLLDMAYYTLQGPFQEDIMSFERKAWQKAMVTPQRKDTCMTVQFSHIIAGGYAAGYYSYKWAEVLDADAFSLFKQNGIFDTETAQKFRQNILEKGGTEHPMDLYIRFRGKKPGIEALMERNGIKSSSSVKEKNKQKEYHKK